VRSTLEPGDFGGNMDTPLVRPGTTVHLPIAVDGALLSVGDAHYAMADGEPCGTGVEGPAWARLVTAVLGGHAIAWPRLETDDEVMVAASARPLETAYRIAWAELVRWVRDETGLSGDDALQLVGQTGRATLGNVCNPSYTVVARVAKAHLPPAAWMDGAHAALRAAAGLVAAPLGPPAHPAEGGLIRMPSP
jgi:acetamidase/formamidase